MLRILICLTDILLLKQIGGNRVMAISLTKNNFNEVVKDSEQPVLIDFYADWCGPCRMAAKFVEEIADEYEGKAKVCKVNVDEEEELAREFKVSSIPTFVMIKDNAVKARRTGFAGKGSLIDMLEA